MDVMQPDAVTPRRLVLRRLSAVAGVAGIVTGLVALIATQLDVDHNIVIVLASVAPLLMIAPLIGCRRLGYRGVSGSCAPPRSSSLGLFGWSVSPLYIGGTGGVDVCERSIDSNHAGQLMVGAADPESLVAMVREREVDVVTVQELTYQGSRRARSRRA